MEDYEKPKLKINDGLSFDITVIPARDIMWKHIDGEMPSLRCLACRYYTKLGKSGHCGSCGANYLIEFDVEADSERSLTYLVQELK